MASPDELIRVTVAADGKLVVGPDAPGRGAWLCRSPADGASADCFRRAVGRGALGRALRTTVSAEAAEHLAELLGRSFRKGASP